jgi:GNAT superfamily N-acetyltransferase
MEPILDDFSPAALAAAVKNNLYALFLHLPPTEHIATQAGEGWRAWRIGMPHPWHNGVLAHTPAAEMADEAIDAALRHFVGYAGVMTWWLAPHLAVEPWRARLEPRGFGYAADTPGMAIDLSTLDLPAAEAPGLAIRRVASAQEMQTWGEVFVTGYALPPAWHAATITFFRELGYAPPIRHYLGLLDGEPVATASLFTGAGVAGVFYVATVPAARRRGIGAAVTLAALRDGRELGYRIGVLQASPQGYPVYQRMGFVEVCKLEHFFRPSGA